MTNETWRKVKRSTSDKQRVAVVVADGEGMIGPMSDALADQIIADHDAARMLADAVAALRQIREAFIEDAAADSVAEITAAGKRIDAAVAGVNAFFAANPDLTAEGGAGR